MNLSDAIYLALKNSGGRLTAGLEADLRAASAYAASAAARVAVVAASGDRDEFDTACRAAADAIGLRLGLEAVKAGDASDAELRAFLFDLVRVASAAVAAAA